MSGKISIDYNAVYAKTAQLCAQLAEKKDSLEREYAQLRQNLQTMDGSANAEINFLMEKNRRKADIICELLQKLAQFIDASAKQYEEDEQKLVQGYQLGQDAGTGQETGLPQAIS